MLGAGARDTPSTPGHGCNPMLGTTGRGGHKLDVVRSRKFRTALFVTYVRVLPIRVRGRERVTVVSNTRYLESFTPHVSVSYTHLTLPTKRIV